jgi:transposase-like protein
MHQMRKAEDVGKENVMSTFSMTEIKKVILQCTVPGCKHEQHFSPDSDIELPWRCSGCNAAWSRPARSHLERDTNLHANFLYLIPCLRKEETAGTVPFWIRFEF